MPDERGHGRSATNEPRLPWEAAAGVHRGRSKVSRVAIEALDDYLAPIRGLTGGGRGPAGGDPRSRSRLALGRGRDWWRGRSAAPPAVGVALAALKQGAPAVVTGQQPGLFGGPIFTWYKTATAIALAQALTGALGEPVVPVFWMATDDSDFEEIRSARVAGPDLASALVQLCHRSRSPDLMVGHLPANAGAEAVAAASQVLAPGLATEQALELAGAVGARPGLGRGLRRPALCGVRDRGTGGGGCACDRAARIARPLFTRYLADPEGYAQTVDRAGEALVARGYERQLGPHATAFPLWREQPPYRRRLLADLGGDAAPAAYVAAARAAARAGERLWAGVALRPLAVDEALPTVARVLGPAEDGLHGAARAADMRGSDSRHPRPCRAWPRP